MPGPDRIMLACSCENTMRLDGEALGHCGGEVRTATQLCQSGLDAFKAAHEVLVAEGALPAAAKPAEQATG